MKDLDKAILDLITAPHCKIHVDEDPDCDINDFMSLEFDEESDEFGLVKALLLGFEGVTEENFKDHFSDQAGRVLEEVLTFAMEADNE